MFYTSQGYTISPYNKELDSLQILGFEDSNTYKEAFKNLLSNNKWITDCKFDYNEIEHKQIITDDFKQNLNKLIDYLWHDEKKHYSENPDENHIFITLEILSKNI